MYRIANIPKGHDLHTGSAFDESHVYFNNQKDPVEKCKGPTAKIDAKKYVEQHAWTVKMNAHGLGDIPLAA